MKSAILKYNTQAPRYTSYPPAPHFQPRTADEYGAALRHMESSPVSLYVHVPFCQEMCWYCGCHTSATKKYGPVEDYLGLVLREIDLVSALLPRRIPLAHIHFGGGSPSMLKPDDFRRVMMAIGARFDILPEADIAVEADPRNITHDLVTAYKDSGVNRVSFGIQDFSPGVQAAINRVQTFDMVQRTVNSFRDVGIDAFNFDLMYGLPKQTCDDVKRTVDLASSLEPQRIAVFGYAHVPWMKKHMRLIRDEDLPDASARIDQFFTAEDELTARGMIAVGLDHFVKEGDAMHQAIKQKTLRRNFQGYTTDKADTMLGLGASSIGRISGSFFQNVARVTTYSEMISEGRLPTARGYDMTPEDILRADIISDLMCYLEVDVCAVLEKHGRDIHAFDDILQGFSDMRDDGLVSVDGGHVSVTPAARQAVRVVAMRFDAHFSANPQRHAQVA